MADRSKEIIEGITRFSEWCEEKKKQFILKNNEQLYNKLYGKESNDNKSIHIRQK
jgi:hypothetical protein